MTGCPDCPDLIGDNMPPGWTPRATCCRDDHIMRRTHGSFDGWKGVEEARRISDAEEATAGNRRQRRKAAAEARKAK